MEKIIYFFVGVLLISISSVFFILYMNLLNMGYSVFDYLIYCFTKIECLIFIPGLLILYFKYLR